MRWVVLILLIGTSLCMGESTKYPKKFVVRKSEGNVLVWQPWKSAWETVTTGDKIWENTLVQVGNEGSLTFGVEAAEGFSGIKANSLEFTINTPMILRLRDDVPRKTRIEDYFIPQIPSVLDAQKNQKQLSFQFQEAWERFAANVLPQSMSKELLKKAATEEKIETGMKIKAKRIKIFNPPNGMMAITERFPYQFRLSWELAPEPNIEYGIRVWQKDEKRPEPMDFTQYDYYSVRFNREGRYLVQIVSKEGRYQSDVRELNVVLPLSDRGDPPSSLAVHRPPQLNLPPPNFVYLVKEFPTSVTFTWERPSAATGAQLYEFQLTTPDGKSLFKKSTQEESFTLKMSTPGNFMWSVAATPERLLAGSGNSTLYSERRTVILNAFDTEKAGMASLERLLAVKASRVFYLESGF